MPRARKSTKSRKSATEIQNTHAAAMSDHDTPSLARSYDNDNDDDNDSRYDLRHARRTFAPRSDSSSSVDSGSQYQPSESPEGDGPPVGEPSDVVGSSIAPTSDDISMDEMNGSSLAPYIQGGGPSTLQEALTINTFAVSGLAAMETRAPRTSQVAALAHPSVQHKEHAPSPAAENALGLAAEHAQYTELGPGLPGADRKPGGRKRARVRCPQCLKDYAQGYLSAHMAKRHSHGQHRIVPLIRGSRNIHAYYVRCPECLVLMRKISLRRHIRQYHQNHPLLTASNKGLGVKLGPPIDGNKIWVLCWSSDEGAVPWVEAVRLGLVSFGDDKQVSSGEESDNLPSPMLPPAKRRGRFDVPRPSTARPVVTRSSDPLHPFQCSECKRTYTRSSDTHLHIRNKHFAGKAPHQLRSGHIETSKPVRYACPGPGCDSTFTRSTQLWKHARKKHPESNIGVRFVDGPRPSLHCPYCRNRYKRLGETSYHVKVDHKDRPRIRHLPQQWWIIVDPSADVLVLKPVEGKPPGAVKPPPRRAAQLLALPNAVDDSDEDEGYSSQSPSPPPLASGSSRPQDDGTPETLWEVNWSDDAVAATSEMQVDCDMGSSGGDPEPDSMPPPGTSLQPLRLRGGASSEVDEDGSSDWEQSSTMSDPTMATTMEDESDDDDGNMHIDFRADSSPIVSHEPLRLRGGAGSGEESHDGDQTDSDQATGPARMTSSKDCALCDYHCSRHEGIVDHVRARHVEQILTQSQAEGMGLILCACGAVLKRRGFGTHKSSCPEGTPATVATPIRRKGPPAGRSLQPPAQNDANDTQSTSASPRMGHSSAGPVMGPAWLDDMMAQDLLRLLDSLPTVYKFLPPGAIKPFIRAASRLAQNFLDNPCMRTLFLFLALPKLALAPGLRLRQVTQMLNSAPEYKIPAVDSSTRALRSAVERAKRYVQAGRLSDAMSALEDKTSIAETTPEVLAALKAKHPPGPSEPFPPFTSLIPTPEPPTTDEVMAALGSFRKDTAAGISGWTVNHLTLACKDPTVQRMMTHITAGILDNSLPGAELLCASRVTPLVKPHGATSGNSVDIRPVAVGEIVYRVATKSIVRKCYRREMLAPFQLGVGTSGGVEPVTVALTMAIQRKCDKVFKEIVATDASNAFNTICRLAIARAIRRFAPELYPLFLWTYGRAAPLLVRTPDGPVFMESAQGVRQGDPLSALFFSIGVRPELEAIVEKLQSGDILLAYLDDFYLLSQESGGLEKIVDTFQERGSTLRFNRSKCRVTSIDEAERDGFEVLGTMVGPDHAQRRFLEDHIAKFRVALSAVLTLPSQHALLLLRICVLPRIRHLMRTLDPEATKVAWQKADRLVADCVSALRWSGSRPGDDGVDHNLITLPIKLGGLGLLSFADMCAHAAAAATESARQLLSDIVPGIAAPASSTSQRERCDSMHQQQQRELLEKLHHHERMVVLEGGSAWGRRWLSVIPFNYYFWMSDTEIAMSLRSRTLVPPQTATCRACGHPRPTIAHAESCNRLQGIRTGRHEIVKYALARTLAEIPGGSVEVEPHIDHRDDRVGSAYNDVRFSGSIDSNIPPMEFDVKVTGVTTSRFDLPATATRSTSNVVATTEKHIQSGLSALAAQTVANLPAGTVTAPGSTFHPFVMSAGGYMEKGTAAVWVKFKDKLPISAASFFRQRVSVGLAQKRAAAIAAVEGNRVTRPSDVRETWSVWTRK